MTQTPPGTPFRLLPDTWECPNCAANKSKFMVIDSAKLAEDDIVNDLANAYRRAALKVKGMPIYNPTLAIEAVGFREHEGRHVGVMLTPWFMNLTVDLRRCRPDVGIRRIHAHRISFGSVRVRHQ